MHRVAAIVIALPLFLGAVVGTAASADLTVRLVNHGSRNKPVIALTFDDGYSVSNCAKIVDILRQRGVTATFFPYARAVQGSPSFWRWLADAGYPIGNHTITHPDMTTLTLAQATSQIRSARTTVEAVTGHAMIPVFRPPYGASDATVVAASRAAGFPTMLLWDVDSRDWSRSLSATAVLERATAGRSGSVVLMHCGPDVTPTILDRIITSYSERGFGFVTVPELLSGKVPARAFLPPPVKAPAPAPAPNPEIVALDVPTRTTTWAL